MSGIFALGAVQLVQAERNVWVATMIGQRGTRTGSKGVPVRYEAIDTALGRLAGEVTELGASVHLPRIGCGLRAASGPAQSPSSPDVWCGGGSR